jgi:hypothetical protein
VNRAHRAWLAFHLMETLYCFCLISKALEALNDIPGVQSITSALAQSLLPIGELVLVTFTLMALMSMLLMLHSSRVESWTTISYMGQYMFSGLVTGIRLLLTLLFGSPVFIPLIMAGSVYITCQGDKFHAFVSYVVSKYTHIHSPCATLLHTYC